MSNTNYSTTSGGIGLPTILFVVFLILKLTHVIAWSWWWVTAPLWISTILGVICLVIVGLAMKSTKRRFDSHFSSSSRW